jgi:hypothetical protein
MGMFAFARVLSSSTSISSSATTFSSCPYAHHVQQWQLPHIAHELHAAILANACLLPLSPLHACVRMGMHALPPLLKCPPPPSPPTHTPFRSLTLVPDDC